MIKVFCDVCRREIKGFDDRNEYKVKVKKRWYSWHESGWCRITLCKDCNDSFFKFHELGSMYSSGYDAGYNQCELDWQRKLSEAENEET